MELDSLEVCEGDTAQVYGVEGPSSPEDSTAHLVTAHFCSGGSESAEQAVFQLDLPAWGRGKCKVVALDPADSTSVLESNEVTFNGGVSDPFEPVVFTASQSRSSDIVSVTAVGTGLTAVQQSSIVASDSSWVVPLALVQKTASSLTATALVPASLPPALLEVATGGGQVASAPLSGDEVMAPTGDYSYGKFHDPIPGTRPKDFCFFYDNLGHFHLFFINTIVGSAFRYPSTSATSATPGERTCGTTGPRPTRPSMCMARGGKARTCGRRPWCSTGPPTTCSTLAWTRKATSRSG